MEETSYLVAGRAARLELFGVVALAVQLVLVDAVRQIDEQLGAGGALEAGRVPGYVLAEFRRHHAERAGRNVAATSVAFLCKKTRIKVAKLIIKHCANKTRQPHR